MKRSYSRISRLKSPRVLNVLTKSRFGLLLVFFGISHFCTASVYAEAKNDLNGHDTNVSVQDQRVIKGVVKDVVGEPLIGVTIAIEGSEKGAMTDLDGKFSLDVNKGDVLLVSYVGYVTQKIKVDNQQELIISLKEDQLILNEVVVTALGIRKEAKALTYNVQQLNSKDLVTVKDANFMNALSGKVAGVAINTSSSGVGGAVKVVMRGTKSISGDNNAMYVIDGVPMKSASSAQPDDVFTGMGQTGDGISMLNAEDIESISVLSGAAASALYGGSAGNGVIMITTKKGRTGEFSVEASSSTTFSSPFVMPKFQNKYGSDVGSFDSWGEKLETPTNYKPKDFFQTGYNLVNSVAVSSGSATNQVYFSIGSVNARGIINNNDLERYNFSFRNSNQFFNNKLNVDIAMMYVKTEEQNMLAQGQYFNPLLPIYLFPRGDDIEKYKTYERHNASRNFKTQYWPYGDMGVQMQNPYWITNRDMFNNNKDRLMLTGTVKYDIFDWLDVSSRVKYDIEKVEATKKYYASTSGLFASDAGAYHRGDTDDRQMYADFMVNANKYFGDFSVTATLGASYQNNEYKYALLGGNLSSVPNLFSYRNLNMSTARVDHIGERIQSQAIFATAQLGYKSMVYLDVTGRNDWMSPLAGTNKDSFFYPSVGTSFILSEMIPVNKNTISFLKARFSYSEVGNAPAYGMGMNTYSVVNGYPQTTTNLFNPNLEPERTKAYEIGLNSVFLDNKIRFDVTLYSTSTAKQLFDSELPASSGYTNFYANGGKVNNKGIELSLGVNQKLGPVDWNTSLVYTINKNEIKSISYKNPLTGEIEHPDELDMGGSDSFKMILKKGGSMGDIYVNTLKTDEHGYIIVDLISQTVTPDNNNFIKAGNANAKYTLGWRNDFNWKGISLGFLINARIGGTVVSATQALMDAYGVSEASAKARDDGGALVNGVRIPAKSYYQTIGGGVAGIGSMYTYSATNIRLAELSVGYDIPIQKLWSGIKYLNVSFVGRNLFMFHNQAPFDPELTASTGTYFQGLDYFMQPSLKNLGFAVKVKF